MAKVCIFNFTTINKQENRWKLPRWQFSIKGRTCNPTPLVHQDITKKTTFRGKKGEIIQVKC